jgi:hypothetical protein
MLVPHHGITDHIRLSRGSHPCNKGQLKPDQSNCSIGIFQRKLSRNKGKVARINIKSGWARWHMPVIPVMGRLKQKDHELRPAWVT